MVPGEARASLDVRHADDALLRRYHACAAQPRRLAGGMWLRMAAELDQPAVACDPDYWMLARAVQTNRQMTSGAGHDAMIVAAIAPVAMLFLRSPGGISHHPAESGTPPMSRPPSQRALPYRGTERSHTDLVTEARRHWQPVERLDIAVEDGIIRRSAATARRTRRIGRARTDHFSRPDRRPFTFQ